MDGKKQPRKVDRGAQVLNEIESLAYLISTTIRPPRSKFKPDFDHPGNYEMRLIRAAEAAQEAYYSPFVATGSGN